MKNIQEPKPSSVNAICIEHPEAELILLPTSHSFYYNHQQYHLVMCGRCQHVFYRQAIEERSPCCEAPKKTHSRMDGSQKVYWSSCSECGKRL